MASVGFEATNVGARDQHANHWTTEAVLYSVTFSRKSFFHKSVEKIQVPLKSDNNNRYFT